jgi:hypothetical protein
MLRAFPMILIAVLAYNAVAFVSGAAGQHDINAVLGQNFSLPMFSGDRWKITAGDMLMALALLLLFVEVIKATRTTHREIVNHALSMLTFMGTLVEFIVLKGFGTSTFFFIVGMCLFDVVAGYTITIITAKRDVSVTPHDNGNDY